MTRDHRSRRIIKKLTRDTLRAAIKAGKRLTSAEAVACVRIAAILVQDDTRSNEWLAS